tara:strand:+ start:211 stop:939 length:729 start_codon:yes stop_codon:yes gene_type:complete
MYQHLPCVPLQPLPLLQRNPKGQARYYFNEAKPHYKYSSVTSILSATQSDATSYALRRWKAKIIAEGGDPDESRNEAARRGTRIHDWFELFLQGHDPAIPDEIAPWCERLVSCSLWKRLDHVVCTEHQVCSDEGLVPFAGTLDALIKINGEFCLFDLKTKASNKAKPSKQISNEAMCQLQAYRLGLAENYGIQVNRFIALYAFPDQAAYPVAASGDELKQHETHWTKRVAAYDLIQKASHRV